MIAIIKLMATTMAEDPDQIAQFKTALARTKTEDIIKKLDDNTIARQWKRDLAEAEVARRTGAAQASASRQAKQKSSHHRSAMIKGWLVTIVLIISAVLAAVAYVMK